MFEGEFEQGVVAFESEFLADAGAVMFDGADALQPIKKPPWDLKTPERLRDTLPPTFTARNSPTHPESNPS